MRRRHRAGKTGAAENWHHSCSLACWPCWHVGMLARPTADQPGLGSRSRRVEQTMNRILIAACALAASLVSAAAQTYPSRPITMVVPFGAGGPTDALARILVQRMSVTLGQQVLIENVTGASGTIGIGRVARAAPDGYTLVIGNWASHVVNSAIFKTPFDYVADFEPVARLSGNPYIIVGKNALPAKTLPELIAWLKANPGKATEGTGGAGSGQ